MGTEWYQKGDGKVKKNTEIELGKNIVKVFIQILKDKKMSIPELARKMGTERRTINLFLSRLEAGKGGSLKTLSKYAEALEIDPFMFFYEVKENVKIEPRKTKKKVG